MNAYARICPLRATTRRRSFPMDGGGMKLGLKRVGRAVACGAILSSCSGGGNETPTSVAQQTTTTTQPSASNTTTTTTTLPQGTTTTLPGTTSIAGRWVGELIVTQNANCNEENELSLDLTQDGSNVGGSGALVTRRPVNCGSNSLSIVGTVGVAGVELTASGQRDGFAFSLRLTGSVSAMRMAGTFVCATACNQSGTWALSR
jgi:hypothetical protein